MKYKCGDKVVIKIDENDASDLNNGYDPTFLNDQVLGKLEDLIPVEEKIKFSEAEKREFDELVKTVFRDYQSNVYKTICTLVESNNYPALNARVAGSFEKQMELLECIRKPKLIEVEKEKKYWIKLADGYLVNVMGDWLTLKNKKDGDIFIQSEIDVLQKQEQFKAIDLNKCKEEVEDE